MFRIRASQTARCDLDRANLDGFTMAELLVTMVLLTLVVIGLAALQMTTIKQVTSSKSSAEATRLAQLVLERYQMLPFDTLRNFMPRDTWFTEKKKDTVTDMVDVGVDGEAQGPFRVESLHETFGGGELVTVRVSWLGIERGIENQPEQQYRPLSVTMSVQRYP